MKLTSNQLKVLAMVTMTLDHIGVQLFPGVLWLRVAGRLAMPIYAWMIAEGCRHTRDRKKYLLRLASLALLCQIVYFFAMGSLYMCILVTFSPLGLQNGQDLQTRVLSLQQSRTWPWARCC